MIRATHTDAVIMEEVTDPVELADSRRQRAQFDLNAAWLQSHLDQVYSRENRGKYVCIAGQQAFVADTVQEAVDRARSAHPSDAGWFTRYVPKQQRLRIYAI